MPKPPELVIRKRLRTVGHVATELEIPGGVGRGARGNVAPVYPIQSTLTKCGAAARGVGLGVGVMC